MKSGNDFFLVCEENTEKKKRKKLTDGVEHEGIGEGSLGADLGVHVDHVLGLLSQQNDSKKKKESKRKIHKHAIMSQEKIRKRQHKRNRTVWKSSMISRVSLMVDWPERISTSSMRCLR
jgi:hypothetical protein